MCIIVVVVFFLCVIILKHFRLLDARLKELDSFFGALPVHNGLWESATVTKSNLLARLAVVHMVHEARYMYITKIVCVCVFILNCLILSFFKIKIKRT